MLTAAEIQTLIAEEQKALWDGKEVPTRRDFLIVEAYLDDLKAKLDKMIKRAVKLGIEPVSYQIGDYVDVELTRELEDGSKRKYVVRKIALHIEGKAPKLAGWIFAATIQHLDGGDNIVKNITDILAPIQYRTAPPNCEHCHMRRNRIDTYLVYHSDTGVWKQIGSNCIADFLGSVQADLLARQAEYLFEALRTAGEGEEEGFGGGRCKPRYALVDVLTLTAGAIEQFGWLSNKKAKEQDRGSASTSNIVNRNCRDKESDLRKSKILIETKPDHAPLAAESLAWAQAISDEEVERNEYLYNIRTIAKSGSIEPRLFGYACSILPAYQRAMGQIAEAKAAKLVSNHVGAVGERLTNLQVTISTIRHIESDFGVSTLVMMIDSVGNRFKWFSSSGGFKIEDENGLRDVKEGETITIKGTVKKHDEYKGMKQTLLSRCDIFMPKAPKEKKPRRSSEEVQAEKVAKGLVKFFEKIVNPDKEIFTACSGCRKEIKLVEDHVYSCPMRKEWFWAQGGQWSKCSGCGKESQNKHFGFYYDHSYVKNDHGDYVPCPVTTRAAWGLEPNKCSGCGAEKDTSNAFEPIRPQDHHNTCPIHAWSVWNMPEPKCSGCGATVHNYASSRHDAHWRDAVSPSYHSAKCPTRDEKAWTTRAGEVSEMTL